VFEATGNVIGAEDGAPAQAPPQQPLNVIQQIMQAAHNLTPPGNKVPNAVQPAPVTPVQNNTANTPVVQVANDVQPMPVPIPGLPGFVLPTGVNVQIPGMLL
jgi:hypothetical protein